MSFVTYNGKKIEIRENYLDLRRQGVNEITEVEGLEKLVNLKKLDLSYNQIVEINGLDSLINLEELYLIGNQISEIEGLDNLVNLKILFIKQNQISDIQGLSLKSLKNLKRLSLAKNRIKKIKGLNSLVNLQELFLGNNQISEIKRLYPLENLQNLYLDRNQIKEIEGLDSLQNLKVLGLPNNQISEIKGLDSLENLEELFLSNNQISSINGLEKLTNLRQLDLSNNQISKIQGLERLIKLELLHLSENQIDQIKGLNFLSNLKLLNLNDNFVKNIEKLDRLTRLQSLRLHFNKINDITGLDMLKNLQKITLFKNQITEIKGLENLNSLKRFNIDWNPISDPEEIILNEIAFNGQDFVRYCKIKKLGKLIPFLNFFSIEFDRELTLEQNIEIFKEKIKTVGEDSLFINIGTHREILQIKNLQNIVFLKQKPDEVYLSNLKIKNRINKDILIHLIQLHSLEKKSTKNLDKISQFLSFLRSIYDSFELKENKILIFRDDIKNRVSENIIELLKLSMNKKEKPNLIILPENSIPYSNINDLKEFSNENDVMIIGGLEHVKDEKEYLNIALIIDKGKMDYQVKQTPVWIYGGEEEVNLKENIKCELFPRIKIFNTSIGRMAIFICKDFLRLCEIIPPWAKMNKVRFIIIPSLANKVLTFHSKLLHLLNHSKCKGMKFIFNNVKEYGGSELFSVKDLHRIEDDYKYGNRDNDARNELIIRRISYKEIIGFNF